MWSKDSNNSVVRVTLLNQPFWIKPISLHQILQFWFSYWFTSQSSIQKIFCKPQCLSSEMQENLDLLVTQPKWITLKFTNLPNTQRHTQERCMSNMFITRKTHKYKIVYCCFFSLTFNHIHSFIIRDKQNHLQEMPCLLSLGLKFSVTHNPTVGLTWSDDTEMV